MSRSSLATTMVRNGNGFLLLEVMVAVMLSAMVVVPLATCLQRATSRVQVLTSEYEELGHSESWEAIADTPSMWGWGPMVDKVSWSPGPELDVWVGSGPWSNVEIGIWADGWLVGDWEADASKSPTTVNVQWSSLAGCEVCIRVREEPGPWGPPRRCIVPDEYGDVSATPAGPAIHDSGSTRPEEPTVALHTGTFSTPAIQASWAEPGVFANAAGLVFFLPESRWGYCEVIVGSERQAWYMEEGRGLDVYF